MDVVVVTIIILVVLIALGVAFRGKARRNTDSDNTFISCSPAIYDSWFYATDGRGTVYRLSAPLAPKQRLQSKQNFLSHAGGGRGVGGYIPLYATADSDRLAGQCMLPGECQWAT